MRERKIGAIIVMLLVAFTAGCCDCDEDPEESTESETVMTETEPEAGASAPVPGPKIILKPSGGVFEWHVGDAEDLQESGPSILDPDDPENFCKLRDDFIGIGTHKFRFFKTAGGQINGPEFVELKNTSVIVRIEESKLLGMFVWSVRAPAGGVLCSMLAPLGAVDTGLVPEEFVGFVTGELTAEGTEDGNQLDLQAKMP